MPCAGFYGMQETRPAGFNWSPDAGWSEESGESDDGYMKKRGIGVACTFLGTNYHFGAHDESAVRAEITPDGKCELFLSMADVGQGADTTMCIIASRELGLPVSEIRVARPDTAVTPDAGASGASRHTMVTGNAVLLVARALKKKILEAASELMDVPMHELRLENGLVIADTTPAGAVGRLKPPCSLRVLADECVRSGTKLQAEATFVAPATTELGEAGQGSPINSFSYCTQIAQVEVDTTTGQVRVLRLVSVNDSGRIVNLLGAEGQVEGACVMSLGRALFEEYRIDEGCPSTRTFSEYLIPTAMDVPDVEARFVEEQGLEGFGPGGAKGLGEVSNLGTAPAIANAIYDAVGVRVRDLPITPEKILLALRAKHRGGTNSGREGTNCAS